jgi:hypothetical protein
MRTLFLLTSTRGGSHFGFPPYHKAPFFQCARTQLGEKPTCPTCWKETTISGFRVNPVMEEAVAAWKDARHVLRHCVMTMDGSFDA